VGINGYQESKQNLFLALNVNRPIGIEEDKKRMQGGLMANPQPDNGHIDIANEIADNLCSYRLNGQEWQVLWVVLRKTWGWLKNPNDKNGGKKKMDRIALSQFAGLTGINRSRCHVLLKGLVNKKILKKTVTQKYNTREISYGFQKDYDKWRVLPKNTTVTKKCNKVLPKNATDVLPKNATTKDTLTKDTIQKKRDMCPHNEIIKLYHTILDELPPIVQWSEKRKKKLRARWNSGFITKKGTPINTLKFWEGFFNYISGCDLLMGRVKKWQANLEWIVTEGNFIKILEGHYD